MFYSGCITGKVKNAKLTTYISTIRPFYLSSVIHVGPYVSDKSVCTRRARSENVGLRNILNKGMSDIRVTSKKASVAAFCQEAFKSQVVGKTGPRRPRHVHS